MCAAKHWEANALRFSVSPSSNINNGSRNETSELFGLPFEFALEGQARALSGVEVSTGLSTRYRVVDSDRKRTDLLFGLSHRTYVLSEDAKDIAPDANGSDFATSSVFVGLQENYTLPSGKAQLGWDARLGRTWYGGDPLLNYNRIGANYRWAAGNRGLFSLSISREGQDGQGTRDDADDLERAVRVRDGAWERRSSCPCRPALWTRKATQTTLITPNVRCRRDIVWPNRSGLHNWSLD